MSIFKRFKASAPAQEIDKSSLLRLGNVELRDVIQDIMMKEAGRSNVAQALARFSGAKRTFYIVSLYEAELSTDGLCRYLVGPGRTTAPYILDALSEIHASRHAQLLKKFTSTNDIDLSDLSKLEISNSWEYEDRKKLYPFEEFNDKFVALYEKESIENRLMAYVRNHIEEFI